VVEDINLVIRQGEFVFVTGSSGAGKSTLLQLIQGVGQIADDLHRPIHCFFKIFVILLPHLQISLPQSLDQLVIQQEQKLALGHGIQRFFPIPLIASHIHILAVLSPFQDQ
jgi:energy-coupling factor transporter ATP-binding protein EcfA2